MLENCFVFSLGILCCVTRFAVSLTCFLLFNIKVYNNELPTTLPTKLRHYKDGTRRSNIS